MNISCLLGQSDTRYVAHIRNGCHLWGEASLCGDIVVDQLVDRGSEATPDATDYDSIQGTRQPSQGCSCLLQSWQ